MRTKRTKKVRLLPIAFCFVAFATFAANAAGVADEIKALQATIASNSVTRTVGCRYFQSWYIDLCDEAEHRAILERNIAAHRRWMELEPDNPTPHAELGKVLAAVGRWDEAEKEVSVALASSRLDSCRRAEASFEMANVLWRRGDRDGAKKLIDEIVRINPQGDNMHILRLKAQYLSWMLADPDGDLDTLKLPHSVDGKPFPTPQEAKYGEARVSLARVEIKFKTNGTDGTNGTSPASRISPVGPEDPIIRLLKRKLTRFGATFAPGGTPILIEISPDAPVDKPQGYSLDVANGKVAIKARSRLGALWGVVSLIQCVDRGKLAICEMSIRDWPALERRGPKLYFEPAYLEYALFNKMSFITISFESGPRMEKNYTLSPLDKERYRIYAKRFNDFGIETYDDTDQLTVRPTLPLSPERTWRLHVAWLRFVASLGIGNSFQLDDEHFPLHKADVKAFGTAANMDAKYVTKLFREIKKDYPGFRMRFCPPFYWGPDSPASYAEPRDPYLYSLGEFLDPEIDVHWTGPSVTPRGVKPHHVAWITERIGRKPLLGQNGDCAGRVHNYIQWGADISAYKKVHCPELFSLIAGLYVNTSTYSETTYVGSCMDWCWNPKAHDAVVAARRTVEQFEGPGVFEIVRDATPSLSYFDKYIYGEPRSEVFTEDQTDLDRRVAAAEKAWSNVLAIAKNGGTFVKGFNRGIGWGRRIAEARRNPPEWLVKQYKAAQSATGFAVKEAGYDESKGDVFIPAELLSGGGYFTDNFRKRAVKYLNPGASGNDLSGSFKCVRFPPPGPYRMLICGMPSFNDALPILEVVVNGRQVFRGEAFKQDVFGVHEVEIPVDALSWDNKFTIRNAAGEGDNRPKPILHYVVIRKQ